MAVGIFMGSEELKSGPFAFAAYLRRALNLFNGIDREQPIGTVRSPNFGQSKNLANWTFSSGSAARPISVHAAFSF